MIPDNKRILLKLRHYHATWTKIIDYYIIPVSALIVVITSAVVIIVYTKEYRTTKHKIRKISSLVYASVALTNIAAVSPKAVLYLYAFSFANITYMIPFNLCRPWHYINEFTKIPHFISILLVALLSLQRFQIVRNPFDGARKWSVCKTVVIMWLCLLLVVLLSILPFFMCKFEIQEIECKHEQEKNRIAPPVISSLQTGWMNME